LRHSTIPVVADAYVAENLQLKRDDEEDADNFALYYPY
jgi:hypothetical protein